MGGELNSTTGGARFVQRQIVRIADGSEKADTDALTAEEPLEIRIGDAAIAVVMRTPGDDVELVAGFLLTEQVISSPADLATISYCATAEPPNQENVVDVRLAPRIEFDQEKLRRNFYASSSCGICGKASIEAVMQNAPYVETEFHVRTETLSGLGDKLRRGQEVFAQTGSLHGAGLFDVDGELLVVREDVGRHNAVDKVVGSYMVRNRPLPEAAILMVSGRASFEIMQKAHVARIPFVAAVSAPSSLAVDLSREAGITLVGFLRTGSFNIYAGAERVLRNH
jgi:FdhD protein